ncbi:DUF3105 domain-containing protein [Nocardioides sp. TRM66260-LWL]|uniref:DUF3105 domain-containing protein n=1 Tax=Nocardioides sp. TRM66260-LWL TaxID=2874478 RepID=UPI001CC790DF|nr:DUF3105 domain-containing protein [Nocardioides sp. TRM66260-LWL]MBZ5734217.1 DUF3105 domain-containing protein [Nocardioides sp. TRM66260-LWL]
MAKKPAKSDRQQVIDEIRRKQRRTERGRGLAIVGVCALVALAIVGATAYRPVKDWYDGRKFDSVALQEVGAPASDCQKVTEKKADGNQQHVPEGTPVTYTTAPPAFGPHWNVANVAPDPMARKLYTGTDRPALEALVHNLEHGYTVLWYDQTIADDATQMGYLRAIADKLGGTTNQRTKFKAVPWLSTDEDGKAFPDGQHVALTHWTGAVDAQGQADVASQKGVFQYCSQVSGAALKTFMDDYPYFDSPEPYGM